MAPQRHDPSGHSIPSLHKLVVLVNFRYINIIMIILSYEVQGLMVLFMQYRSDIVVYSDT